MTMKMKSFDLYNKAFDNRMFDLANKFRISNAFKHAEKFVDGRENTIADIKNSFLNEVVERNPFNDCADTVAFTRFLNDYIIDDVLSSNQHNLIEKISIIQYVIELSAREFISPSNLVSVKKHLAASKSRGYFFTPPSLALRMVKRAIDENADATTVMDPACGAGIFLSLYVILNPKIEHVIGIEVDEQTAVYGKKILESVCLQINAKTTIDIKNMDYFDFYKKNTSLKFDTIIMNPPYGNLKFMVSDLNDFSTISRLSNDELTALQNELKHRTTQRAQELKRQFLHSGLSKGVLELSKVFMAAAINQIKKEGVIVAITPSTWLGDENSSDFRQYLLQHNAIKELWNFDEVAKLFKGVNQPTTVSIIRYQNNQTIKIYNHLKNVEDIETMVDEMSTDQIIALGGSKIKIPKCDNEGMKILEKLNSFFRLSTCKNIVNARGELDLSASKQYVQAEDNGHRLIRGDHIDGVRLKESGESEKDGFVRFDDFIQTCPGERRKHVSQRRIVITQCSYLKKKKRIETCLSNSNMVISNSCNFLAVDEEEALLFYFSWINSSVIEWYFRMFNYNNHVANYELADMPIISYENASIKIKELINKYINRIEPENSSWFALDAIWAHAFGLTEEEFEKVLFDIGKNEKTDILKEYKALKEEDCE